MVMPNDRKLKKVLIIRQILLKVPQEMYREECRELAYWYQSVKG